MNYFFPDIKTTSTDGFSQDIDIFKRENIGEQLSLILKNSPTNIVASIDNDWGEGKSTFLKMWQGHLYNKHEMHSIYFDAFKNDYIDDPFSALLAEIFQFAKDNIEPNNEKLSAFKKKAIDGALALGIGGLKFGIRYLTMNALDGSSLDSSNPDSDKLDKAAADELVNLTESAVNNYLENYSHSKTQIETLTKAIESIVNEVTKDKPLIFIVDELDRCKPSYSIELLEKLKHVFCVPNVHFVLGLNRKQLEANICSQYGNLIEPTLYIQKFVNFSISLPMNTDWGNGHWHTFINSLIHRSNVNLDRNTNNIMDDFKDLSKHLRISFRECERIFSLVLMCLAVSKDNTLLFLPLVFIKVLDPELFKKLETNRDRNSLKEVETFIKINSGNYKQLAQNGHIHRLYLVLCVIHKKPVITGAIVGSFDADYEEFKNTSTQRNLDSKFNKFFKGLSCLNFI